MPKGSHKRSRDRSQERSRDKSSDKNIKRSRKSSKRDRRSRSASEGRHDHSGYVSLEDKLDALINLLSKNKKKRILESTQQTSDQVNAQDIKAASAPFQKSLVTDKENAPPALTVVENARSVSFDTEIHTIAEQQSEADFAVPDFKRDLLGDNELAEVSGPPIHDLLVEKLSTIFSNGFTKETRELLIKKYPPPANLPLCRAPLLNQEIRQVLPLSAAKRDDYQCSTQKLIGAAISAQTLLLLELLKPEISWDTKDIFEKASDAARLTAMIQHHISLTRRSLISPMLTLSAKNALDGSAVDKKLFGEQFLAKMKETASADKLVKGLTRTSVPTTKPLTLNTRQPPQRRSLQGNEKPLARKTQASRPARVQQQNSRRRSRSRSRTFRRN
nr:PREDICTED: uncharacterized protein LOC105668182 [Linepithema humile]